MTLLSFIISALLTQAPSAQPVAPPNPAPVAKADDLATRLDTLDKKIAALKDLTAEFEQRKKSALLKRPMVSNGVIKLKGQKTRWDTVKPHPTVMTIDAAEVRVYYPEQKTVEVYPVQGEMAKLASSPLPRMSIIREQFEITEIRPEEIDPKAAGPALALVLSPKAGPLKEHVERIRVLIDTSTACAKSVEVTDADGDQTTITFTNVKLNTGVSDSDVQLVTPKGTSIARPLEGGSPKPEGGR